VNGAAPFPDDPLDDVEAEIESHLQARTEALVGTGLDAAAARAQAIREFGDVADARTYMTQLGRRTRQSQRRRNYMEEFIHDVRYAIRRLLAAPAFAVTCVATLAIGIGATTAIFSVVYGVLFRPLPFPDAGQLYAVYSANRSAGSLRASVSPVDLDDWRAARNDIQDIGGVWYAAGTSGVDVTGRGEPRRLSAAFFTPGFLEALAVTPAAGRLPREEELVRGGPDDVVMLGHGFWTREFAADPGVVGTSLTVDNTPHTIIGVLPASMPFPDERADLFVPYSTIPDNAIPRLRGVRVLSVIARAKPGVPQARIDAEMAAITARLSTQHPEDQHWGEATVVPLAEVITGDVRDGLLVLFGAVALVLLMAAVNVAALQVARTSGRGRELAVRLALGARRTRVVRQLLTESLVLAGVGCVAGVLLAHGLLQGLLILFADQLPRIGEIGVDAAAIWCAVGSALVCGVIFGVVPAFRPLRTDPQTALQAGSRGVVGAQSQRLRQVLVVAEVAVAMMLIVGAGLMSRSFVRLLDVDPGFAPAGLVGVQFTIDGDRFENRTDAALLGHRGFMNYYSDVIDRVRALPGVESAAAVKHAPFRGNGERYQVRIAGRTLPAGEDAPLAATIHISDGYFNTIGARMVDGREFTRQDRAGAPLVLVVNEAFAREYLPGERAVGHRLAMSGRVTAEIIGVVNDIRQVSMAEAARPTMYLSNLQNGRSQATIVARTSGDPLALAPAIRQAIWDLNRDQAIADVFTFDDSIGVALARPRLLAVLLGSFGLVGLVLGALGIYGVLSALVSQGQREIGVRLALGAQPADVRRMVVRRGMSLTLIGLGTGLVGAFAVSRYLESVLFGVGATDPATFAAVAAVLALAALAASWLPAHRAARVDPVVALRAE
jgi:predicted permease